MSGTASVGGSTCSKIACRDGKRKSGHAEDDRADKDCGADDEAPSGIKRDS